MDKVKKYLDKMYEIQGCDDCPVCPGKNNDCADGCMLDDFKNYLAELRDLRTECADVDRVNNELLQLLDKHGIDVDEPLGDKQGYLPTQRTAKVRNWSEDEFGHYRCDKCGFVLGSDYVYCPNCGARLDWSQE